MSILIQKDPSKFMHNAAMSRSDIVISNIDGKLYELYFKYKFSNLLLTITNNLSNEIRNFIIEFGSQCNIVLYHKDQPQQDIINDFYTIKHIVHNQTHVTYKNTNIYVLPKFMVNTDVFHDMNLPRHNKYCVFLDNIATPKSGLINLLYPKTKLPINIFNAPDFPHPQNLGILRGEAERAHILNTYEYFIDIDQTYIAEAYSCHCKVVNINNDGNLVEVSDSEITQNIVEYTTFLQDIFV